MNAAEPCVAFWMPWCADNFGSDRGPGVVGDRTLRHEDGLRKPVDHGQKRELGGVMILAIRRFADCRTKQQ